MKYAELRIPAKPKSQKTAEVLANVWRDPRFALQHAVAEAS